MYRGFTLIQISILLVVASLVLVAILPSSQTTLNANNATTARMNKILTALRGYEASHAYLPCPADASLAIGNANYGAAASNPGTGTPGDCFGGAIQSNYVDTTNNVAIGMVPVKTLGLANEMALDAYGRDITYAVDINATTCFATPLTGQIQVLDNNAVQTTNTVAALLSAGADGHGGWIPLTGSGNGAKQLNTGTSDVDEQLNAQNPGGGSFPSNYNNGINTLNNSAEGPLTMFVRKPLTSTFDDLVVYRNLFWSLNVPPASVASIIPNVTAPANGNYILTQPLTFTMTFPQAVLVNANGNKPQLDLYIGGNTRYATYRSGTGTNTLTFTYYAQPTDFAPTGISMMSSVDFNNGGSITSASTGGYVNTCFVPPNLSGITVSAPSGIVVDTTAPYVGYSLIANTNNGHLSSWPTPTSNSPNSFGTRLIGVVNPAGISQATGNNASIYVANTSGNDIIMWNSFTSNSIGAFIGNGFFSAPMGAAADTSTNCWYSSTNNTPWPCMWVTDTGDNEVQRCSLTVDVAVADECLAPISTLSGATPNTFSYPTGIVVDSVNSGCTAANTPCTYVADTGNNRIVKLNGLTGAYVGYFGAKGAAGTGGEFSTPTAMALDATTNCAGGPCLWIADSSNNQVQQCAINAFGTISSPTSNQWSSVCTVYSTLSGASPGSFSNPTGISVNSVSTGCTTANEPCIYVVDGNNNRVVILTNSGSGYGYGSKFGSYGSGSTNFNF